MGNSLISILINTDYRNKGVVQAQGALKGLSSGVQDVAGRLGLFNAANLTAAGMVAGLAVAVKKATTNYIEYADQVRAAATLTGMTATEASRLIQVTDDYGISQQQLTTILEQANKKGFLPSIENLAALSDEYLATEDPLEANQLLTDRLGRSGMDLVEVMKLGGDAIRERAAAVEDGLILDEAALAASREYQFSVDDLEDSLKAMSQTAMQDVVPALQKVIEFLTRGINVARNWAGQNQVLAGILAEHEQQVLKTAGSYEEYIREMVRAGLMAKQFEGAEVNLAKAFLDGTLEAEKQDAVLYMLANSMGASTAATFENDQALANWSGALDGAELKSLALNSAVESTAGVMDAVLEPIDLLSNSMRDLTAELLYNQAAQGLDDAAALSLARSMGLVDEATYAALNATNSLRADLDAGKITLEEYEAGVLALGNAWGLVPSTWATDYTINVSQVGDPIPDFGVNDPDAPITPGDEPDGPINGMLAAGGPVRAGGGYWVGEQGPEWFRPGSGGRVYANGEEPAAGIVINLTGPVSMGSEADVEKMARRLAEYVRHR